MTIHKIIPGPVYYVGHATGFILSFLVVNAERNSFKIQNICTNQRGKSQNACHLFKIFACFKFLRVPLRFSGAPNKLGALYIDSFIATFIWVTSIFGILIQNRNQSAYRSMLGFSRLPQWTVLYPMKEDMLSLEQLKQNSRFSIRAFLGSWQAIPWNTMCPIPLTKLC